MIKDYQLRKQCLLNQRKEVKKLKDEQLKRVLVNIESRRQDFEDDTFKAGYIQAMLNYGIISSEQYESIY